MLLTELFSSVSGFCFLGPLCNRQRTHLPQGTGCLLPILAEPCHAHIHRHLRRRRDGSCSENVPVALKSSGGIIFAPPKLSHLVSSYTLAMPAMDVCHSWKLNSLAGYLSLPTRRVFGFIRCWPFSTGAGAPSSSLEPHYSLWFYTSLERNSTFQSGVRSIYSVYLQTR